MKKYIVFILSILLISAGHPYISAAEGERICDVFTDDNFRVAICEKLGISDENDLISDWEEKINEITEISLSDQDISSLDGIEYFGSLELLDVSANKITELDLSQNSKLKYLIAGENPIKAVDLSVNAALEYIYLQNCELESVSVPTGVRKLYLYGNQLSFIDLGGLTALEELSLKNNRLLSVDMAENPSLKYLWLDGNKLENIEIDENMEFEMLSPGNQTYDLGLKIQNGYSYAPSWRLISTTKEQINGKFTFSSDELPTVVYTTVNIQGYPMYVELICSDMSGDVTGDNTVNSDDLSELLYNYGTDVSDCDIDQNGTVSAEDLSVLLSTYSNTSDR